MYLAILHNRWNNDWQHDMGVKNIITTGKVLFANMYATEGRLHLKGDNTGDLYVRYENDTNVNAYVF